MPWNELKRLMLLLTACVLVVIAGIVLATYAVTLPAYVDDDALTELARTLQDLPREERMAAWREQLPDLETPHKRLFGLGANLTSLGVGAALTLGLGFVYQRVWFARYMVFLLAIWLVLWASRYPLTFVMYHVRFGRGDYPSWADTFIIGIVFDWVAWTVGAAVTTVLLLLLRIGHPVPDVVSLRWPRTIWGWVRATIICLWIGLLAYLVFENFVYFDEGIALIALPAIFVLVTMLAAQPVPKVAPNDEIRSTEGTADAVNGLLAPH